MQTLDQYVGVRDAAMELGLKPNAMKRLCEAKKIGGKFGKCLVLTREELERLKREPIRFDRY